MLNSYIIAYNKWFLYWSRKVIVNRMMQIRELMCFPLQPLLVNKYDLQRLFFLGRFHLLIKVIIVVCTYVCVYSMFVNLVNPKRRSLIMLCRQKVYGRRVRSLNTSFLRRKYTRIFQRKNKQYNFLVYYSPKHLNLKE